METCSLFSDEEILAYITRHSPRIVSIDCPLGLPGGGTEIDPQAGIVRVAEQDLSRIGIPAYPALIDSMQNLTLRGIRLRRLISDLPHKPIAIESYPGAAQDILSIPRKQQGLDLLREGLRRLGLTGPGLETRSHDEMDAIREIDGKVGTVHRRSRRGLVANQAEKRLTTRIVFFEDLRPSDP